MAYGIEKTEKGYEWYCFQSAYGAASGIADSLPRAKVELVIAESDLFERPLPPAVVRMMRENPEKFAADYPDP